MTRKLAFLLVSLAPGLAFAQGASVNVQIDLPAVLPQLVVVSPGIRVVPDCDREVFFVDNYYYVREDGYWYRSNNHRGGWVMVEPRRVPPGLARMPPGQYKKWHPRPAAAPMMVRPGPGPRGAFIPAPVYRERGDHDHDGDHDDHGRGKGKGHHKHDD
jgi:hypothetical protein